MEQGLRSNAIYRINKSQRCKGESPHAQTDTRMKMHQLFGFLLMLPQKLWVRGGKREGRRMQQDNATEGLFRWRPIVQLSTLSAEVLLNKSSERYWWWTLKKVLDLIPGLTLNQASNHGPILFLSSPPRRSPLWAWSCSRFIPGCL